MLGRGDGTFHPTQFANADPLGFGEPDDGIDIADLDGDGADDVVLFETFGPDDDVRSEAVPEISLRGRDFIR